MFGIDIDWLASISDVVIRVIFHSVPPSTFFHQFTTSIVEFSTSASFIVTPISFIFNQPIVMITHSIAKSFPIYHYSLVNQQSVIIIHFTKTKWNSCITLFQHQSFKPTSMVQIHDSFFYRFLVVNSTVNLFLLERRFLLLSKKRSKIEKSNLNVQGRLASLFQKRGKRKEIQGKMRKNKKYYIARKKGLI